MGAVKHAHCQSVYRILEVRIDEVRDIVRIDQLRID